MSQHYNQPRVSSKEANYSATRDAMTKRRQEWTNRIRKSKKNQQLALKRRYVTEPVKERTFSLVELANQVVQNPVLRTLAAFQAALSSTSSCTTTATTLPPHNSQPDTSNPPNILKPEDLGDPSQLIRILGILLADPSPNLQLTAARILTNLAAMEPPQQATETSYYGRVSESWSTVIARSDVIQALQKVLSTPTADPELIPQACWALGNLVGDSQVARDAAMPLLPSLVQTIKNGQQSQPWLCRNAAWALSNLARGGHASQTFCGPALLTPSLLAHLLMSPERVKSGGASSADVSWWDVAHEVAWVIAFLTAKEDETVNYLCLATTAHSFSAQSAIQILEALACRLASAAQALRTADSLSSTKASQAIRMGVPCVRAIGNIASSCQGKHLKSILEAHSGSIVKSIATLLELGSFPSSHTVAVEAAWAARTLLCDAGLPNHESTEIAVPVLLPPLCKCVTSGYSKSDLKREAMSALWTAVAAPPHGDQSMGAVWSTRATRDEFLHQIASADKMILTVVDLLRHSMDMDVIFTTVQLVNAMVRRGAPEVRFQFEQYDGVNALEHVCDMASADHNYGSGTDWGSDEVPAADIAADLIDDVFEQQAGRDEEMEGIAPQVNGSTFSFGVPPTTSVVAPVVVAAPTAGRGRGRPVPAWMTKG